MEPLTTMTGKSRSPTLGEMWQKFDKLADRLDDRLDDVGTELKGHR